jgi:hypothetical protein
MNELQQDLVGTLGQVAARLRETGLPDDLARQVERLAEQVEQPCVVAVVGRVKAGKSTFINALLGEDLAKVGTTETTATINYFRYGQPNRERPVRCYWRNGQCTDESPAFLDALQGNDVETLRRAEGIDHLEYRLLNPYLERVTLVDTPGTGAVVDEHQARTAEFMQLTSQLRERHNQETQRLGSEADAVIYLVGPTARSSDREFLDEFAQATGAQARALNAIGVLAKVDLQPEVLARRHELAGKVSRQLQESLNTVIPVSAGIRRALDDLLADDQAGLTALAGALRRIPPARLEKFLSSEELFLESEPADCPVSTAERARLLGAMPWGVFTTIARTVADPGLDPAAMQRGLELLSGFDTLKDVLERHFLKRSHVLRAYRIMKDTRQILDTIKFVHLPAARQREREQAVRRERFLAFIRQASGDTEVARELSAFIQERLAPGIDAEGVVRQLERACAGIFHDLEEYNADFEALQALEQGSQGGLFSPAELDELRALLGLYGMDLIKRLPSSQVSTSYVEDRQQHWSQVSAWERNPIRASVAERAVTRYGLILNELLGA